MWLKVVFFEHSQYSVEQVSFCTDDKINVKVVNKTRITIIFFPLHIVSHFDSNELHVLVPTLVLHLRYNVFFLIFDYTEPSN